MNEFRIGAMVRVKENLFGVLSFGQPPSFLGFITDICTHSNHRHGNRCIEITYLKPRQATGRIDRNILVSYPYHDVSLVSSTEAKSNE